MSCMTVYNPDGSIYASLTFVQMQNEVPLAGDQWKNITAPGVPGVGEIWIGYSSEASPVITTSAVTDYATLYLAKVQNKGCQGKIATVTDDAANVWYNIKIDNVSFERKKAIVSGVGSLASAGFILRTIWQLRDISNGPQL